MKEYDLAIIGGGVSGTSLFYLMSQFTNINRLCLIEKHDHVAPLNSSSWSNSQTLHVGDIESNYSLEQALSVQKQAYMLRRYALKQDNAKDIIFKMSKMLLASGAKEIAQLRERYQNFKPHYPNIQWWDKAQIAQVEPTVGLDEHDQLRSDEVAAIGTKEDWCAVNYAELSQSFINNALKAACTTDTFLSSKVFSVEKNDAHYHLTLEGQSEPIKCRFLVVAAGAHSLLFAHRLGYGQEYSTLSVGGSFYYSNIALNGKVYTMQNPHLPFAAVHGDPDVAAHKTRFGPTALFMIQLERHTRGTMREYFELLKLDKGFIKMIWKMMRVTEVRNYVLKNFLFELPYVRECLFAQSTRKIIPGIKAKNLTFAKGIGGNRPQIVDRKLSALTVGDVALKGQNVIFNITASSGASTCVAKARESLTVVAKALDLKIDEDKLAETLDYE